MNDANVIHVLETALENAQEQLEAEKYRYEQETAALVARKARIVALQERIASLTAALSA